MTNAARPYSVSFASPQRLVEVAERLIGTPARRPRRSAPAPLRGRREDGRRVEEARALERAPPVTGRAPPATLRATRSATRSRCRVGDERPHLGAILEGVPHAQRGSVSATSASVNASATSSCTSSAAAPRTPGRRCGASTSPPAARRSRRRRRGTRAPARCRRARASARQRARGAVHEQLAHPWAAGEGDLAHPRVVQEHLRHPLGIAVDDVDDAGGAPASCSACASANAERGVSSLGRPTTVQPAASAAAQVRTTL
jgi:hypothetical protein